MERCWPHALGTLPKKIEASHDFEFVSTSSAILELDLILGFAIALDPASELGCAHGDYPYSAGGR